MVELMLSLAKGDKRFHGSEKLFTEWCKHQLDIKSLDEMPMAYAKAMIDKLTTGDEFSDDANDAIAAIDEELHAEATQQDNEVKAPKDDIPF